ncbi:MAG: hypothetical protein O3C21_01860 [Verrucomicrobia bacterium]|nr:hypothetical protein [Verrucomicrobiota bacterium]
MGSKRPFPGRVPAPVIEENNNNDDNAANAKEADGSVMITERTLQASLVGHLLSITDGKIQFQPVLGNGAAPVSYSQDTIQSLRRIHHPEADADTPKPASSEKRTDSDKRLVTFRSGSSIPGRLLRVSTAGLVLAFGESNELTIPLKEILSINPLQSDGKRLEALPSADGRHVARLTTGEVITGNIAPVTTDRDRLTISSPILSGEFPLKLIESMLFPTDSDPNAARVENGSTETRGREILIHFSSGASLASPTIRLMEGMVELEIWEGTPFRTSLSSVESITFIDSGTRPNGPIFLWGQHSDKADEFEKLKTTLKGANLSRELIIMDGEKGIGDDFSAALRRSSAFVWAEWEKLDMAAFESSIAGGADQPVGEQLQTYVQNGGIAVFLGLSGTTAEQFARLGLGRIESSGSIGDGSPLELIGVGELLAPFTDGNIKAANSTMMYKVPEGGPWNPLLAKPGSHETAAIAGRPIGSGWVFLMGMDFYETNENVARILTELLRFRR